MEFDNKYDRRIFIETGDGGDHVMLTLLELEDDEDVVSAALGPEEVYKIYDWIAENVERPFIPKNAREIIDRLPVGATFRLYESENSRTMYLRKTSDTTIQEYLDETFTKERKVWDFEKLPRTFTGWTPEEFSEFSPVSLTLQHWEQMPVGAEFGFGTNHYDYEFYPYKKVDGDHYESATYGGDSTEMVPYLKKYHLDAIRGLHWRVKKESYTYGPEVQS